MTDAHAYSNSIPLQSVDLRSPQAADSDWRSSTEERGMAPPQEVAKILQQHQGGKDETSVDERPSGQATLLAVHEGKTGDSNGNHTPRQ
jgi:hypothetical protein